MRMEANFTCQRKENRCQHLNEFQLFSVKTSRYNKTNKPFQLKSNRSESTKQRGIGNALTLYLLCVYVCVLVLCGM